MKSNQTLDSKKENLIYAIKQNNEAVVNDILSLPGNCDYINFRLYKTLYYDPIKGALFKKINACENFFENLPRTPLTTAVYYGREKMVEWLIKKGADVNLNGPYLPLEYAILYLKIIKDADALKKYQKIQDMLIEQGAKLTERSEDNIDTLMESFLPVTVHILKRR